MTRQSGDEALERDALVGFVSLACNHDNTLISRNGFCSLVLSPSDFSLFLSFALFPLRVKIPRNSSVELMTLCATFALYTLSR